MKERHLVKLLFVLLGFLSPVFSQAQTITENNLKQLEFLRFKAMVEEDTTFLKNVMADDCVYLHSNGLQESKTKHLSNISTRYIDYQEMVPEETYFRIYDGFAIGNGVVMVTGTIGGQSFTIPLKYTDVYQHTSRGWKLLSWQSVKLVNYEPPGSKN
ncbi:MAG: nuclear transport factor 2 family protein [Saprospiraceae bacterium]|nr:nuclear transport factor 2 family protein [Saprospiraceae bacterium]